MEQQPETTAPVAPLRPPRSRLWAGLALVVLIVLAGTFFAVRRLSVKRPACGPEIPSSDSTYMAKDSLGKGEVLAGALARWCLSPDQIKEVYTALSKADFNFRNMRAGDRVKFRYQGLNLSGVTYSRDLVTSYSVHFDSSGATANKETKPVDTTRVVVRGTIKGSLWNSMTDLGETPASIVNFAEVLSYEVDFLTEVSEGDSFEMLVDKCYVDSQFYRDGRVSVAHFKGKAGNFYGFYYQSPSGHWDYYNDKGQSLRKTVLRSPLRFATVTSYFGMRYHPILKTVREHAGVDYGAPSGTPVSAIADGTISIAGWTGGYGRLVEIRHAGGLASRYGHLSGFGAGVREGARARQGQTIGYVGMTGLATGPHLHFEVRQGGKPVNPLKVIPPRAEPVASRNMPEFNALKASYLTDLARPAGPLTTPDSAREKRELPLPQSKASAH